MADFEVVELKPRAKLVNENVVEVLENFLKLAKEGELIGCAVAGVLSDGSTMTTSARSDCFPSLVGAVSILHHRIIGAANGPETYKS